MRSIVHRVIAGGMGVLALGAGSAAAQPPPTGTTKPPPLVLKRSLEEILAEKIAKQLVAASPVAATNDAKARDAAGEKLAACDDLINAANGRIMWGGFHPEQGYDPEGYRLNDRAHDDWFQQVTPHDFRDYDFRWETWALSNFVACRQDLLPALGGGT